MDTIESIRDIRIQLAKWGNFWASKNYGQGYASKSNVQSVKEACEVGCASTSTLHLFSGGSDSIIVPDHIEVIDRMVDSLDKDFRAIIVLEYKNKSLKLDKQQRKDLRRAERKLLSSI